MLTYDRTLTAPDDFTLFDLFTGRPDSLCDLCDADCTDQPMLSVHDRSSAPEYITHLACYLFAAHTANTDDD